MVLFEIKKLTQMYSETHASKQHANFQISKKILDPPSQILGTPLSFYILQY